MIEFNTEGITPTAAFISNVHTGKLQEVLPEIFMIKGAKNDRGFDQGYAVSNGKKDLVLIDVVEEPYKEALQYLQDNDYNVKAILITGKDVKDDCYADLQTLSEDTGGADIYIHPELAPQDVEIKQLKGKDELLSNFGLEALEVPEKDGQVVLYCSRHDGIIFTGDSAVGSDYGTDEFLFTRGRELNEKAAFTVEEFWKGLDKDFDYFFTRKGKPAIEVDERTRATLLSRLGEGKDEVK